MRFSRKPRSRRPRFGSSGFECEDVVDGGPIASLSGGNQQKVMFGKALRLTPKMLLLDEPTQGVDIGAKDQIHRLVEEAAEGVAVSSRPPTPTNS